MEKLLAFKIGFKIGDEFWLKPNQSIGSKTVFQTLNSFVSAVLPNIYIIAGIILFIYLLIGGIGFIKSAGQENTEGLKKAQQTITTALVGFLIIFASYWIIQLIEIVTGLNILKTTL